MQLPALRRDPRLFQLAALSLFLSWGIFGLHWDFSPLNGALFFAGSYAFTWIATSRQEEKWIGLKSKTLQSSLRSVSISALSLCILLQVTHWTVALLAAALTVGSKYLLRYKGKHLFNPSAFGIVATILLTGKAWISVGQWGSSAVLAFGALLLGTLVVTRVQKLDASLAFLLTFAGGLFIRQIVVLGWPMDYFTHSLLTGNLLIFSFFMISDPRTSPAHRGARIAWAMTIGAVAFYFTAFQFANSTAIFTLVAMAPVVPLLDRLFRAQNFNWKETPFPAGNRLRVNPVLLRGGGTVVLLTGATLLASAFCGFYVSKASGTLKNKTSEVILVRDGQRTSVTMYNDFQGDSKDFAMVVPVPVVLKEKDIKVVDPVIFKTLNEYSQARLVEYHDENPCEPQIMYEQSMSMASPGTAPQMRNKSKNEESKVKIEAQYLVGEYDILILSATESSALKDWLNEKGYKIPANAEEVLDPYIRSGLKFFVVKVNEKEKAKLNNNFLRPIQISYASQRFMLPIRLGMANADGDQDILVYSFTKKGRVELSNYRTVKMPTGQDIPLFVNDNFSAFYTNLFKHQWQEEGKNIGMVEYAWDVSPRNFMKCDPCVATAPSEQDLLTAGVWWMGGRSRYEDYEESGITPSDPSVFFTRLHIRYNRKTFPQDLQFAETADRENFQARYVLRHPATGNLNCDAGKAYKKDLKKLRHDELENLQMLTGRDFTDWDLLGLKKEEAKLPADVGYAAVEDNRRQEPNTKNPLPIIAGLSGVALLGFWLGRKRK